MYGPGSGCTWNRRPARVSGRPVKITVCESPHETRALADAWTRLCQHTAQQNPELVILPEFACIEPLWERDCFDAARWAHGLAQSDAWVARLGELRAANVVSTRPAAVARRQFNEGFAWSSGAGLVPLRRKYYLPNESGGWEARWFTRGDREFRRFTVGGFSFGLNICTELWALETYSAYAAQGIDAVICPRATSAATTAKWLAAGTVAAVRSGAYCLSSNRVHPDGSCGGYGWIISPDGVVLATTSRDAPFCTLDLDVAASKTAARTYPRYVFAHDRT
jgi:N-carbamoylputrescine amidase